MPLTAEQAKAISDLLFTIPPSSPEEPKKKKKTSKKSDATNQALSFKASQDHMRLFISAALEQKLIHFQDVDYQINIDDVLAIMRTMSREDLEHCLEILKELPLEQLNEFTKAAIEFEVDEISTKLKTCKAGDESRIRGEFQRSQTLAVRLQLLELEYSNKDWLDIIGTKFLDPLKDLIMKCHAEALGSREVSWDKPIHSDFPEYSQPKHTQFGPEVLERYKFWTRRFSFEFEKLLENLMLYLSSDEFLESLPDQLRRNIHLQKELLHRKLFLEHEQAPTEGENPFVKDASIQDYLATVIGGVFYLRILQPFIVKYDRDPKHGFTTIAGTSQPEPLQAAFNALLVSYVSRPLMRLSNAWISQVSGNPGTEQLDYSAIQQLPPEQHWHPILTELLLFPRKYTPKVQGRTAEEADAKEPREYKRSLIMAIRDSLLSIAQRGQAPTAAPVNPTPEDWQISTVQAASAVMQLLPKKTSAPKPKLQRNPSALTLVVNTLQVPDVAGLCSTKASHEDLVESMANIVQTHSQDLHATQRKQKDGVELSKRPEFEIDEGFIYELLHIFEAGDSIRFENAKALYPDASRQHFAKAMSGYLRGDNQHPNLSYSDNPAATCLKLLVIHFVRQENNFDGSVNDLYRLCHSKQSSEELINVLLCCYYLHEALHKEDEKAFKIANGVNPLLVEATLQHLVTLSELDDVDTVPSNAHGRFTLFKRLFIPLQEVQSKLPLLAKEAYEDCVVDNAPSELSEPSEGDELDDGELVEETPAEKLLHDLAALDRHSHRAGLIGTTDYKHPIYGHRRPPAAVAAEEQAKGSPLKRSPSSPSLITRK